MSLAHALPPVLALPVELVMDIADHLDPVSLRRWASSCTALRRILMRHHRLFSFAPVPQLLANSPSLQSLLHQHQLAQLQLIQQQLQQQLQQQQRDGLPPTVPPPRALLDKQAVLEPELIVSTLPCGRQHLTFNQRTHSPYASSASLANAKSAGSIDWTEMRWDAIVDSPSQTVPGGVFRQYQGLRRSGDRCLFSRTPLSNQLALLDPPSSSSSSPSASASASSSVSSASSLEAAQCVYFEVEILAEPSDAATLSMRIGLVGTADIRDHEHPPGCTAASVGYRSNDGYIDIGQRHELFQFAPPWRVGDTVGCGYAHAGAEAGLVFFTLNGEWVGDAPFRITTDVLDYRAPWHAAVSSGGPARMLVNMGSKPFRFVLGDGQVSRALASRLRTQPCEWEMAALDAGNDGAVALCMQPNVLSKSADPYLPPTVSPAPGGGETVVFPDNGADVTRSVLSSLPFGYTHTTPSGYSYYEVHMTAAPTAYNAFISIGLATKPYSPFHHIGWDTLSVGHHSDDGRLYNNTHQAGVEFAAAFGAAGSVVGVGFNAQSGTLFYTRDGVRVGGLVQLQGGPRVYYAAVGAIRAWVVDINFGQRPFVYDVTEM